LEEQDPLLPMFFHAFLEVLRHMAIPLL
jgi:hypothetical protein